MEGAWSSRTSQTLLGRLRQDPTDPGAWEQFVDRYGRKIFGWCREWGLQDADALDVTQNVLLKLSDVMRRFVYDPTRSFRGWLKTLTHHAWRDFLEDEQRTGGDARGEDVDRLADSLPARDDLIQKLWDEFDRERLEVAMFRVQLRVSVPTWEAFRLQALEECSGKDTAAALGLSVAAVFMAKSRVQQMIREEIARLARFDPD
jgi:RNA polymerase sigma factor (sigma-70 family)